MSTGRSHELTPSQQAHVDGSLGLVARSVGAFRRHYGNLLSKDELTSIAFIAVRECAHLYREALGTFARFAWTWIRFRLFDAFKLEKRIEQELRRAASVAATAICGSEISVNATDETCRKQLHEYAHGMATMMVAHLISTATVAGTRGDDTIISDARERNRLGAALKGAMASLDEDERHIITNYYFESQSLKSAADVLELSYPQVRRRHASALIKLEKKLLEAVGKREL